MRRNPNKKIPTAKLAGQQLIPANIEWRGNTPYSPDYGDIYFSDQGGIEETRYVFLHNNGLPERWAGKACFTIIETGFGTGLNFYVTAKEWLEQSDETATLHFISVEKHPLAKKDLQKLKSVWPQYDEIIQQLIDLYPPMLSGFHSISLCNGRIRLLLLFGDAVEQFSQLVAQADACYLDGFAPAKNDAMWSQALFQELARILKPSATVSTFTAVGNVRRGLIAAGFDMRKTAGYGSKREMLVGTRVEQLDAKPATPLKPWYPQIGIQPNEKKAVVAGAGIAGITTACALAREGWHVILLERADDICQGASGNPAGVIKPRLDKELSAESGFYWLAFFHTLRALKQLELDGVETSWQPSGVIQLVKESEFACKVLMDEIVSPVLDDSLKHLLDTSSSVYLPDAGYINPTLLCRTLLKRYEAQVELITECNLDTIERNGAHWLIKTSQGEFTSEVVILCNASDANRLNETCSIELQPVRGQISFIRNIIPQVDRVIAKNSYLIPETSDRLIIGASYERNSLDTELHESDHVFNREQFMELVNCDNDVVITGGRASIRAMTPNHLPVVGIVPDTSDYKRQYADMAKGKASQSFSSARVHQGLYVNAGHGSRGLTSAFLSADYLVSEVTGEPSPLPAYLTDYLHPARSIIRSLKKKVV